MTASHDHPAVSVLYSFFKAMNDWGWDMIRHHRSLEGSDVDEELLARDRQIQRRKAEAIFEQYCEAGAKCQRFQDFGLAFTDPPEYDPELESIPSISERAGGLDVTTQAELRKTHYKY
jgi:hypothetical protein